MLFEEMNEQDVREEVIAPLIRKLGYRSGTEHHVIREQGLRYAFAFLGRKDPGKDVEIRGKADYILEAQRRVRWVVEAKAPQVEIDAEGIEQAFSYANHAEIRAVYFALCNGRQFHLFRTSDGPQAEAKLKLGYEELDSKYLALASLLEPGSVLRDFPDYEPDYGMPIATGLRSLARVTRGLVTYTKASVHIPFLKELSVWISEGSVQRNQSGKLVATLDTISPIRSIQRVNEKLGFSGFEMLSNDETLSSNPSKPTEFSYSSRLIFPAGEEILDLATWKVNKLEYDLPCDLLARAVGSYKNQRFAGVFLSKLVMHLRLPPPVASVFPFGISLDGDFEIHLA